MNRVVRAPASAPVADKHELEAASKDIEEKVTEGQKCEQLALSGLAVAVIRWTSRPGMVFIVISAEFQWGMVLGVRVSTVGELTVADQWVW